MLVNKQTWPTWASLVAAPAAPEDYVEAAVERLMKKIDPYVVRVRGVRPQFDAINSVQMIEFQTAEERLYYEQAYDRYLKEKAKLEESAVGEGGFQILVEFLKFRMAAEYCRRSHLAKAMYEAVTSNNQAAVCALNFKNSIIAVVKILVQDYGISRDQISLVWGGGQTALTKKQKAKQQIQSVADKLESAGESVDALLESLDLDTVDDRVLEDLPAELRLGSQSPQERQREIDKFQSGKSLFCLYTFRAGGVGLSLHHSDEHTKEKVRRQKNGYAMIEDIPNIPVRPRINFVAPTYSAIELVQGLGRCPRLTSLSNTPQVLVFYAGTIEVDVAHIVSAKLKCLSKVVRQRESWNDVIVGHVKAEAHINNVLPDVSKDGADSELINESEEE